MSCCRAAPFLVASAALLWPSPTAASCFSLRFHGNGSGEIDRVKVAIDAPPVPADVGDADFMLEFWLHARAAENTAPAYGNGSDAWINGNIVFDRDVFGPGDHSDYGISIGGGRIGFGVNDGSGGASASAARSPASSRSRMSSTVAPWRAPTS